ncbi:MAG: beta-galactosidase, partial [Clostridia bacterium]|nr:beta-galactosidase [Clostridia bacterium]
MNPVNFADPKVLHENLEQPRAYYIPKRSDGTDAAVSLNGEWNFAYYESILEVPEALDTIQFSDKMTVPGCWECAGFGQKQYLNVNYPIPFEPPFVPQVNPVGVYETAFEHQAETGSAVYAVFEGVSSAMMLYINHRYVGMTKGSHLPAEFELTPYLADGRNTMTAIVFTWSSGTYLEDQDAYRYHGIFRDVYLIRRPAAHLRDFFIHAPKEGTFSVDLSYTGTPEPAKVTVISPDGHETPVADGKAAIDDPA